LCHSGRWDRLYQAFAAAASASAVGQEVILVFYFQALAKLVEHRLDEFPSPPADGEGARLAERAYEAGTTPPSELLAQVRKSEKTRILACSASVKLEGLEQSEVAQLVDEIVGWPTVTSLMSRASHVLYI
jgi:peroxiredoxin family protein